MAAVYFALLPSQSAMASIAPPDPAPTYAAYTAVPTGGPDAISASLTTPVSRVGEGREPIDGQEVKAVLKGFSAREKLALARPLVYRYMLPLFLVYLAEYTVRLSLHLAKPALKKWSADQHRHRAGARIPCTFSARASYSIAFYQDSS